MTIADMLSEGLRQHQAGNFQSAEEVYRKALNIEPTHIDALHLLGVVCDQSGRSDEAVGHLQEAIRLRPKFAEAHFNLGNVYRARKDLANALLCFGRAVG